MCETGMVLFLAGLPAILAAAEPRSDVSLNGRWDHQVVASLADTPDESKWQPCTVPGYLRGIDYQCAWFRTRFDVPPEMRGRRVQISFGGVKFNSRVVVNGTSVGGCFGGHEPFDVDITAAVRFGESNELLVGCHDWTGVFSDGRVELPPSADWDALRNAPRDKILSPIGGLFHLYGIWDDVTLRFHPPVHVQEVFVRPSVRNGELVVQYLLANQSSQDAAVQLRAWVEDRGKPACDLPSTSCLIAAGKTQQVVVRQAWKDPPLWSPQDPHLLFLRTDLSTGDRVSTRFGFREVWTDRHRFYLNGAPLTLLATSWWPPHDWMTRDAIRERWAAVKRMGAVAFRTHTQPWPAAHYDVADEIGLLMIVEGAVWNDDETYRVNDPVFWENYARHLHAMVRRDQNRPSVVMWSLENEFFGSRLNDTSPAKQELARMGTLVKSWDNTRPIFYESDGDPDGVADLIGIHYPHEYPDFTCWPNEADWLREPASIPHMFLNGAKQFSWRKDKPLYVGEFLWIPSSDPSWHTVFFGDEAYRDYNQYRNLAKAESWKMQILGYRRQEVAGISPWTVIEGGELDDSNPLYRAHHYAYQPVAAYPCNYDSRFFAGETVRRELAVFNDVAEPSELHLKWQLTSAKGQRAVLDHGEQLLLLGPAEHRQFEVKLQMPSATEPAVSVSAPTANNGFDGAPLEWTIAVERNGSVAFQTSVPCTVHQRPVESPHAEREPPVFLFDPLGTTRAALDFIRVPTQPVSDLRQIPADVKVLVIGSGSLQRSAKSSPVIGKVPVERQSLSDFVARGGRLLVLHQDAYPEGLFDVELSDHRSTMTFCLNMTDGPLQFAADSMKFWRGDHLVATHEPTRPAGGGFRPLVVSGSDAGINYAPLLLQYAGSGCIIYSQLLAVEKARSEPAAAAALARMVEYLRTSQRSPRKTGVLGPPEYAAYLRSLGLAFDELTEREMASDLASYGLLICRGSVPGPERLLRWVESGGQLLVHRASAESVREICGTFRLDLTARPYSSAVTRAETGHPLLAAITREDLYWLGTHTGIGWSETPRSPTMSDGVLARTLTQQSGTSYEIEDWQLEGGIVERRSPGVMFATAGSAAQEITVAEAGDYLIGLQAQGSPCRGVYPTARIRVDNQVFGVLTVTGEWETTCVAGPLASGKHTVSVSFINDGSDPPQEDRNLWVDKVVLARDDTVDHVHLLTQPAALAAAPRGRGLVVIDQLRWDTEEDNARKAARYAGALLTELGGNFAVRHGVTLECERMTPQAGMPFFSNQGSQAALACNGYVETAIEVAASRSYTLELLASGTPVESVYPLVDITVDGTSVGRIQLMSGRLRPYRLNVDLTAGTHVLRLWFINDLNKAGEDRNVMLDHVRFY